MDSQTARAKIVLLFLVVVACLIAGTAGAQDSDIQEDGVPEEIAPVLLRGSMLLTPAGTTCTGIAPEVKLRMSIDERGRVTDVEILDVKPSTELDDVFRRATVDTV